MPRLRVIFGKGEGARFLSHLDLLATLEYSLRRARLPLELSEGYTPRPRISVAAALPLGHIGEREILEITLREDVPLEAVRKSLQEAVPSGITILAVEPTGPGTKRAAARLQAAVYRIRLEKAVPDLTARVESLLSRDSVIVQEERDGRVRTRDVRPLILDAQARGDTALRLRLRLDGAGTVRPEAVLEVLGIRGTGVTYVRERIELAQ